VRRLGPRVAGALMAFWICGCGPTITPDEVVPLDKVPPAIMRKAQETLPGFKVTGVWRKKIEDGRDVFEVRGKNKQGQTREVEISPEGEVVTVE
jgi:hypothetical protein